MKIRSLGRYEVRGELGRGTMGVVYRGYDPVLDREIALKTVGLPAGIEPERRKRFLERFFLEAKIAAKLIHPNIVVTHDAATDETTSIPFIAMELVSGESLQARIARGPIAWREALALIEPLARALDYAHRAEVVHRDIKPANVMLSLSGVPKIADFGIAKLPDTHLTQSGKVMGTPYFMSPEQLRGDAVDGRSDLFSLGALLYNLLTGEPPFRGADLASITQQVLYKSPTPPSEIAGDIPEDVDGLVARAMAKEPDERYRDGEELAQDIARVRDGDAPLKPLALGERTVESTPLIAIEPDTKSDSSRGGLGMSLVVVFFVALAGAAWYEWDAISRLLEPMRVHQQELERREGVRREAAVALEAARDTLTSGELDRAEGFIDEALSLSRDAKDGAGEASALLLRGRLEAERGEWSKARADIEGAASVFAIYELPEGRARAILELGDLERDLGRFDVAESRYDEAEPFVDTTGSRAMLALMHGDLEAAERGFREAGELVYAGAVALARGDAEAADELWQAHPDAAEIDRWRHSAASPASDSDESLLQKLFLAETGTRRDEERRRRLP